MMTSVAFDTTIYGGQASKNFISKSLEHLSNRLIGSLRYVHIAQRAQRAVTSPDYILIVPFHAPPICILIRILVLPSLGKPFAACSSVNQGRLS